MLKALTGPADATEPLADSEAADPLLDQQKLDVYRVAVEFHSLAAGLLPWRGHSILRDQLDRASLSIVLNIAEGAGRFSPPDKARLYAIARGSATECAAILDVLLGRGIVNAPTYRCVRSLLVRIVQMLTKLASRLRR